MQGKSNNWRKQLEQQNAAHWRISCDGRFVSMGQTHNRYDLNYEVGCLMRLKKKKKKLLKTFSPCTRYQYVYISADFVPFYFSSPVMHACFCAASLQVLWLIGNCNLSVAASVTLNGCFSSWQLCDAFHC